MGSWSKDRIHIIIYEIADAKATRVVPVAGWSPLPPKLKGGPEGGCRRPRLPAAPRPPPGHGDGRGTAIVGPRGRARGFGADDPRADPSIALSLADPFHQTIGPSRTKTRTRTKALPLPRIENLPRRCGPVPVLSRCCSGAGGTLCGQADRGPATGLARDQTGMAPFACEARARVCATQSLPTCSALRAGMGGGAWAPIAGFPATEMRPCPSVLAALRWVAGSPPPPSDDRPKARGPHRGANGQCRGQGIPRFSQLCHRDAGRSLMAFPWRALAIRPAIRAPFAAGCGGKLPPPGPVPHGGLGPGPGGPCCERASRPGRRPGGSATCPG